MLIAETRTHTYNACWQQHMRWQCALGPEQHAGQVHGQGPTASAAHTARPQHNVASTQPQATQHSQHTTTAHKTRSQCHKHTVAVLKAQRLVVGTQAVLYPCHVAPRTPARDRPKSPVQRRSLQYICTMPPCPSGSESPPCTPTSSFFCLSDVLEVDEAWSCLVEDEDDGKHTAPALAQQCSSRGGMNGGEEAWQDGGVSGGGLWVVSRPAQQCSKREQQGMSGGTRGRRRVRRRGRKGC